MTGGVLSGGWSFVVAAYAITIFVWIAYTISVVMRLRDEMRRAERARTRNEEVAS